MSCAAHAKEALRRGETVMVRAGAIFGIAVAVAPYSPERKRRGVRLPLHKPG